MRVVVFLRLRVHRRIACAHGPWVPFGFGFGFLLGSSVSLASPKYLAALAVPGTPRQEHRIPKGSRQSSGREEGAESE